MARHRQPSDEMLAGFALRNGVVIISPRRWGVALRAEDGSITTLAGERTVPKRVTDRIPVVGNLVRLVEQLLLLPRVLHKTPGAELPMLAPSAIAASLGGAAIAGLARRRIAPGIACELAIAGASIVPMLVGIRFDRAARYHGAEHKVIAAHEQGIAPRDASRLHPRCGTTLAVPLAVMSALLRAGLGRRNPLVPVLSTALALETARAAIQRPDSPGGRLILGIGLALQRVFTTAEPSQDELEVGSAALDATLEHTAMGTAPS